MMNLRNQRGFSLIEMIVVVAIIGTLSLVSVPAFINFQRTQRIRGALRTFAQDIRVARQIAISRNTITRIEVISNNTYQLLRSDDEGETWIRQPFKIGGGDDATSGSIRYLDNLVRIDSVTFADDTTDDDANTHKDIDFHSDGTVWDNDALLSGTPVITLRTDWDNAGVNKITITISSTGQLTTAESKV
jgi:prepilin-type N-terminal cleavage/methylation domain-containing protein